MPETYKVKLSDGRSFNVTTEGGPPSEADVMKQLGETPVNVGAGATFSVNGKPEPSAVSRFASSAWQNVNPVTAIKGVAQMLPIIGHPLDTIAAIGRNSAENYAAAKTAQAARIAKGGILPSADEVEHSLGAVPLVGPALQEVAEKINLGDLAGAAGSATGLALPYTRPLKTAAGLVGPTARAVLGTERAGRVADVIGKVARNKVVETIAPQVGSNKVRFGKEAAKVSQELIDRGLSNKWSREGVHKAVNEALNDAALKLDEAVDSRPVRTYDTQEIISALEAKRAGIQSNPREASKWPRKFDDRYMPDPKGVVEPFGTATNAPALDPRIAQINEAIERIKGLGPNVGYEDIRKLRAGYDKEALAFYHPSTTQDYIKNMSKQIGAADVTGALREFLASKDPATAAANAEWSLMKRAKDVLDATEEVERVRPKVGRKIMSRVTGSIAGSEIAGLAGAMAGFLLAPMADVSIGMGVTQKLKWAQLFDKTAKAIRSGNQSAVDFYAGQMKRTLAQAGVLVERGTQEGMAAPYQMPQPVASHTPTVLDKVASGRHTLSDGTVWDKLPDGTIRQVK